MTLPLQETCTDHRGNVLPIDVYAQRRVDTGALVAFRVRWRQIDDRGRRIRPSRSFAVRKLGSLDRALDAAIFFQTGAEEASRFYRRRVPQPGVLTANDVFGEWMKIRGVELSVEYIERKSYLWEKEIATRPIGDMRLREISSKPSLLVAHQDELVEEGLGANKRREIWKLVRAVLRWGSTTPPRRLDDRGGRPDRPTRI